MRERRFKDDSDDSRGRSRERRPSRDSDGPRERRPGRRDSGRFGRNSDRGDSGRSRGPRSFDRRRSDRGDSDHEMHSVVCDKCGKDCEVPFKPTSSKPIFCDECFRENKRSGRGDRRGSDRRGGSSSRDMEQINKKLDKIMEALKISE